MAWNYGQRAWAAGIELAALLDPQRPWLGLALGAAEAEAELRLPGDGFGQWALRGWLAADREREVEQWRRRT